MDSRLRERRFGIFEGLTAGEIQERFPQEHARFVSGDPDYAVPGGESARGFAGRCLGCLSEIAGRHRGEEIVVVTHGLVLDSLYRAAQGLGHGERRPVPLINASLNFFGHGAGRWRLVLWGDVTHLAPGEVTQYGGTAA
jgi:probable phosphoglycerate mutase